MRFRPLLLALATSLLSGCATPEERPPNIVVIFADDLGYGDLGVYGHPTIRTPNLDRMAAEGLKFTQFYSGASVCTPSRAALLTGRLPIRSGMASDTRRVLFPNSKLGLPAEEITIAEALQERGYATAAIGKWHLGHQRDFLPTRNGFDTYFGIPYSNDMDRVGGPAGRAAFDDPRFEYWNVPLMRDEAIIERPADQRTLTRRYTEEATSFIRDQGTQPFFVYLAHGMMHVPLFRSDEFAEVSRRGLYGDAMEEVDWSVGEIMRVLREEGLADNTLVVFTSDNGPWLVYDEQGGSAGLLRGGKGMTWEGGMRAPAIAWWPGTIAPGLVSASVTSTMDILPTALELAGADVPADRIVDGRSLVPILNGAVDTPIRDTYFYYRGATLYAARMGPWKAHYITQWAYTSDNQRTEHNPPLLFHLDHDPSEQHDLAGDNPDVVAAIGAAVDQHRSEMVARPSQMEARVSAVATSGKHLFILSGQSNMARLDPAETFTPAVEAALGADDVIVVKDAAGGQPIRRWYKDWRPAPGQDPPASGGEPQAWGDLYDRLMARVDSAAAGVHIESVTFVWMQGERDARESHGEVYGTALEGLVAQLKTDLGHEDINVVIGRLSDFDLTNSRYPHWTLVRQAQSDFAKSYPRAAWVGTDDLNDGTNRQGNEISDDLHMSEEGYRLLGERFAAAAIGLISGSPPEVDLGHSVAVQEPALCSTNWIALVDSVLTTGDGQGHGPDLGSEEWKSVVEFKLGVRGSPDAPNRSTVEWCRFVDERLH